MGNGAYGSICDPGGGGRNDSAGDGNLEAALSKLPFQTGIQAHRTPAGDCGQCLSENPGHYYGAYDPDMHRRILDAGKSLLYSGWSGYRHHGCTSDSRHRHRARSLGDFLLFWKAVGEGAVSAGSLCGMLFPAGDFGGKADGKPGGAVFSGNFGFHVCGAEAFRNFRIAFGTGGTFAGGGPGEEL